MAEALGLAASIIAVVGLAGQVVQGCQTLRTFLGDFNNAPADIQQFIRELDTIRESAKTAEQLGKKGDADVQAQLEPALRLCFEAVEEIRTKIVNADLVFKEGSSGKSARGWYRLKAVFEKQGLQAAVDKLSRAKADLVVAQSNVLLHLSQNQQEQLKGMGESLALGLQTSQNSSFVLDSVHEVTRGIHSQVVDTATAVTSLRADMGELIDISRQSQVTPYMVAEVERAMEKVLQKHTFRAQESPRAEHTSCISVRVAERGTPHRELNAARCGPHYHSKRELLCKNPLITICKTTFTAKVQSQDDDSIKDTTETSPSYRSITTCEVRVNLGLWRRGLRTVFGGSRNAYIPGRDFHLSTYHIVDRNAPVFQAARKLDIERVRTLFSSGCASPFDQIPRGFSLFDWAFICLCVNRDVENAARGLKLLKFILDCGGAPNLLRQLRWIPEILREPIPFDSLQIIADAVRLMFEASPNDPIYPSDVIMCMTIKSERTPVGQFLRQQDQWPLELGPAVQEIDQNRGYKIYETDRQISEDEDGLQIAALLTESVYYQALSGRHSRTSSGIHSILDMYGNSEFKQKIRTGCRNRIAILLRAGWNPRGCEMCQVNINYPVADSGPGLEMSVTQYALLTNTADLWVEALKEVEWTQAEVDGLLEEEQYRSVPNLLNGELEFKSQAENREEFLQTIVNGGYHGEDSSILGEQLAIYINMNWFDIEKTIDEARQVFNMKFTPGSWQEDEASTLVFGVDFFLRGYWGTRYTSFEEYDRRYERNE